MPRRFATALRVASTVALVWTGVSAGAATLSERDVAGGFGGWTAPTAIAPGVTEIRGRGAAGDPDHFLITAPATGTIEIVFAAPEGIGHSYSAGGVVKAATAPFRWDWDGRTVGRFQLDLRDPTAGLALALAEGWGAGAGGALHLALYFTHGAEMTYAVSLPGGGADLTEGAPSVPLPAGALLLPAGLAALGLARASRRRRPLSGRR